MRIRLAAGAAWGAFGASFPAAARVLSAAAAIGVRTTDTIRRWWAPIGRWLYVNSIPYYITSTLRRRIIFSNVLGLVILFFGLTYVGRTNALLIDARREALTAQGEIIARAIFGKGVDDAQNRNSADGLGATERALSSWRNDDLSTLEYSISPEFVNQVLNRLLDRDHYRARVFARDMSLIADTNWLLKRGELTQEVAKKDAVPRASKDFWTRALQWWMRTNLPVYRDLGTASGSQYREVEHALRGEPKSILQINDDGDVIVSVAIPVQRAGNPARGVLLLSTKPGTLDDALAKEQQLLWLLGAIAALASIAASALLARTVADPIKQLSAAAEQVSHNINARQQLPDYSSRRDEVGQLFRSFEAMTTTLYGRIDNSEKFAADVAHELKNPLTAARSMAESLNYARTDEQRNQLVTQIQHELKRLNRLITDVSNASRLDAELARQETAVIDLGAVAEGVVSTFRDLHADSFVIRMERDTPTAEYAVQGHDGRLGQVLTNLMDNAISFSPRGGEVVLRLGRVQDQVVVSIDDSGPGIPPDKLEKIFQRFYTDRPQTEKNHGKNSGLGLSICREIIKAHNGRIVAQNRYRASFEDAHPIGARFRVELPSAQGPQPRLTGFAAMPRRA